MVKYYMDGSLSYQELGIKFVQYWDVNCVGCVLGI